MAKAIKTKLIPSKDNTVYCHGCIYLTNASCPKYKNGNYKCIKKTEEGKKKYHIYIEA